MTVVEYVRLVLAGDAAVAALVSDRVFVDVLPQSPTLPALVFGIVSGDEDYALDGPTSSAQMRVQVDAWDATRRGADILARAVKAVLSGHTGGAEGLRCDGAFLINTWADYEPDTKLYHRIDDYDLHVSGAET